MPLFAGDIKLENALKDPLAQAKKRSSSNLQTALGRIQERQRMGADVSGRPMGEYAPAQLNQTAAMADRGINDRLLGVLGGGAYDDAKSERDFQRELSLAEEIGGLLSPSMAEQILGGLSQGTATLARGKGLYDALGQSNSQPRTKRRPINIGFREDENNVDYGDGLL